ncbi:MAG: oxidoreductase [Candidatus Hydrogenedentota bacterium]
MAKVRAGVVGVGHLGYHHARIYAESSEADLVGVVDMDSGRRAKASSDFQTQGFDSIAELLKAGVDAVSIVVPTRAHASAACQALEAGVDVLVEKPIATTLEEARAIVGTAARCGRLVQVGHIERFNGAVMRLFEAVKKPRFIECHRLSPYPNRGDDVSVVLDLMIHDLEIVRALAGAAITRVDASGVSVFSHYEDIANARLRFASGCVANITSSRISMERMRKIRIFSEDAYVSTDYSAQEITVYRKKPGAIPPGSNPMEWIEIDVLPVEREEPLKLELHSFLASVLDRKRPLVSGDDALEALELADQVMRAIKETT